MDILYNDSSNYKRKSECEPASATQYATAYRL